MFSKDVEPISVTEMYDPVVMTGKSVAEAIAPADEKPNFKGQVKNTKITFPDELGEEHPFDFNITDGIYKKFGFANGVVNKYVDFIIGPGFYVESDDDRATKIIEDWMQDVNFDTVLRDWVKESLVKNGFLELGGKPDETVKGAKVLDAKYMYVDRDNKGVVKGYNQYKGAFDKFTKKKVIPFKPYQVAHLSLNKIGDMAYGMGIIYPALNIINNLLQNERDLHMLMGRKANAPYHVKMGGVVGGKYFKPNPETVTKFGKDLEWLNNKHEWVTDGLTEIKVIDFGNIGEKFNEVLKYDTEMLLYAFQVPSVLMGTANINEGIAKVQMDAFERRVGSLQAEIEKVIETKIFRRILNAQGLEAHVELVWGRPSNTEKYERLMKIAPILTSQTTSQSLSRLLERETVKILDLDEVEYEVLAADEDKMKEEERKKEENRAQAIVPGQNAKPPKATVKQNYELSEGCEYPHCADIEESLDNYNDIQEWLGFNYKDYTKEIEKVIVADGFTQIVAENAVEEAAGRLSKAQVMEFKTVLAKGFRNGQSISEMVKAVDKKVKLKDLLRMEDGKIVQKNGVDVLVRGAKHRAVAIVRTEVTRVANQGAINHYKEGGITKIKWVASVGKRTCPECEALNGEIYNIDNHPAIPVHPMCRCTVIPVTELL